MTTLTTSNMKRLHETTKTFHAIRKEFKAAVEALNQEKMMTTVDELTRLENEILDLLCEKVEVQVYGNGFVLTTRGHVRRIKLTPVEGMGVVKFKAELVKDGSFTIFNTQEEAEQQMGPCNYALFRAYIEGIGAAA